MQALQTWSSYCYLLSKTLSYHWAAMNDGLVPTKISKQRPTVMLGCTVPSSRGSCSSSTTCLFYWGPSRSSPLWTWHRWTCADLTFSFDFAGQHGALPVTGSSPRVHSMMGSVLRHLRIGHLLLPSYCLLAGTVLSTPPGCFSECLSWFGCQPQQHRRFRVLYELTLHQHDDLQHLDFAFYY